MTQLTTMPKVYAFEVRADGNAGTFTVSLTYEAYAGTTRVTFPVTVSGLDDSAIDITDNTWQGYMANAADDYGYVLPS